MSNSTTAFQDQGRDFIPAKWERGQQRPSTNSLPSLCEEEVTFITTEGTAFPGIQLQGNQGTIAKSGTQSHLSDDSVTGGKGEKAAFMGGNHPHRKHPVNLPHLYN